MLARAQNNSSNQSSNAERLVSGSSGRHCAKHEKRPVITDAHRGPANTGCRPDLCLQAGRRRYDNSFRPAWLRCRAGCVGNAAMLLPTAVASHALASAQSLARHQQHLLRWRTRAVARAAHRSFRIIALAHEPRNVGTRTLRAGSHRFKSSVMRSLHAAIVARPTRTMRARRRRCELARAALLMRGRSSSSCRWRIAPRSFDPLFFPGRNFSCTVNTEISPLRSSCC